VYDKRDFLIFLFVRKNKFKGICLLERINTIFIIFKKWRIDKNDRIFHRSHGWDNHDDDLMDYTWQLKSNLKQK